MVKGFSCISKGLRFNSETLLGGLPLRVLLEVWILARLHVVNGALAVIVTANVQKHW